MTYEYMSDLGALTPPRLTPTRTEIMIGGITSTKRKLAAEEIRDEQRRVAAAAKAAAEQQLLSLSPGFSAEGGSPSDDSVAPSDDFHDPSEDVEGGSSGGGAVTALWIGLGVLTLGGGAFLLYKLFKGNTVEIPKQTTPTASRTKIPTAPLPTAASLGTSEAAIISNARRYHKHLKKARSRAQRWR